MRNITLILKYLLFIFLFKRAGVRRDIHSFSAAGRSSKNQGCMIFTVGLTPDFWPCSGDKVMRVINLTSILKIVGTFKKCMKYNFKFVVFALRIHFLKKTKTFVTYIKPNINGFL